MTEDVVIFMMIVNARGQNQRLQCVRMLIDSRANLTQAMSFNRSSDFIARL